jgi:hypothetical protein
MNQCFSDWVPVGRMAWFTLCLSVLAGCLSEIPRSSVTGQLKLDGESVPQGVQVVFTRQGSDPTACIGVTNDQGMYVMYHKPGMKGLLVGRYTVAIALPGDDTPGPVMLPPMLAGIKIPQKYRMGSSELTCDVPRGGTVFDIEITTK